MRAFAVLAGVGVVLAGVAGVGSQPGGKPAAPGGQVTSRAAPERPEHYEDREVGGYRVHVNKRLLAEPELLGRVMLHLAADLDEVDHFVPGPARAVLKTVEFWVEKDGAHEAGKAARGLCCHWSRAWLADHGVLPEKAGHVEIMNPADFLEWRRDQPYMLFHEMAHAMHWRLGRCDGEIKAAYDRAMKAKLYDAVPRNTMPRGKNVKAYAAENDHEYFAELSEAYFAVNDFYPFKRPQLQDHDGEGMELMERVWGMTEQQFQLKWSPREAGVARPRPAGK